MPEAMRWSDQPAEIATAKELASFNTKGALVAIYRGDSRYYLTVGGLFGSQTISATNADAIIGILGSAMRAKTKEGSISITQLQRDNPQADVKLHEAA